MSHIIYQYNDMSNMLVWFLSNYLKEPLLRTGFNFSLENNLRVDYLSNLFVHFLSFYFHPIHLSNLLFFTFLILSLGASFLWFQSTLKNRCIAITFSLLYSFSIFYLFRVSSFTYPLYAVFSFPLLIYMLRKRYNSMLIGFYILFILMVSNYYGFFALVVSVMWLLLQSLGNKSPNQIGIFILSVGKLIAPTLLVIVFVFSSEFRQNVPWFGGYTKPEKNSVARPVLIYRSMEDFYNFSFRPWYFFIPPKSSLFFGDFSRNTYQKISETGYYLAHNYDEEEASGSYMGWHFLLGLLFVAALLIIKKINHREYAAFQHVYRNQDLIVRSFALVFFILLITGPPSFTVRGIEIYTPSYLMYYFIPVFRVLVRWSVVIYLFVLVINSFLVLDLYYLMKVLWKRAVFISGFLILNFLVFAIHIPAININEPPSEIEYLKNISDEGFHYAVYPDGDYYSIFWILSHRKYLINPRDFINYETGFVSNLFSQNLVTHEGIAELKSKQAEYFIYYPNRISDSRLKSISRINPNIEAKEDVTKFFNSNFGDPVYLNEAFIYKLYNEK